MIISRNNRFSMGRYRSLLIAAAIFCGAFAAQAADPGAIEVVASNFGTGEFTLRVPSSEKPLELYWAAAWADDTDEYSQWRAPLYLQSVPAGTTEVTVTVPGFSPDAVSRFFLADPDNATVTRPVSVIGGKDGDGHFNSAFVTGLHPDYDWKYEIVFDVPEFASNQSWLLCNRANSGNTGGSLLLLAITTGRKMRFGYGAQSQNNSTSEIAENVRYMASIDGRTCVYSNLTGNVHFYTSQFNPYTTHYGEYSFWFGASSGGSGSTAGLTYNANDKCSYARVYSFKAWNGSGELVGDFRPMVTNGVAGYFDLATRRFFQSGDGVPAGETHVFAPYVASAETQHVDSLVAHLGALAAVSPALKTGPVEFASGSLPFAIGGIPLYGNRSVDVGDSVTFSVPADKFICWDESTRMSYRVASAGLRIDTFDANAGEFVVGTPQPGLRSYTFTRNSETDGVRVVCLWDAEMLVDPPDGLRAECLRLVDVATNANGKTEVGHGPFNTGVHPVPATTRVFADVYLDSNNRTAQNSLSPVNERRFFGCRDESAHGQAPGKWQYTFQLTRQTGTPPTLRVDMCNYMDGAESQTQTLNIDNTARFEIDLNPTFTRLYDVLHSATHLAEMKDTGYARSSEPLIGTLHIFGQQRLSDTTAPLCVDYNNTRYYTYAVWTDGVNLSRDYAPCIDAEGKPAFYDRVARNYIYPIGDKAEIVAEFTGTVGTNSVYVTGENEKGEPAAYLDPDATAPGYYKIADGGSETFTAAGRMVFGRKVKGYRIDTWTDGTGWVKGAVQSGYTATLDGEKSFRRLVWLWGKSAGLSIFVR